MALPDTEATILEAPHWRSMAHALPGVFGCAFMFHLCGRFVDRLVNKRQADGAADGKTDDGGRLERVRRFRVKNLTVCLGHSLLSGWWAVRIILSDLSMLTSVMTYYTDSLYSLVQLSAGYFVHDAVDMASFQLNKYTLELLLHHTVSLIAFGCALGTKRMLVYAAVSLLMEVNSVFLHLRSLSNVCAWPDPQSLYCRTVRALNLVTFLVCRLAVQSWMVRWFLLHSDRVHTVYWAILGYGNVIFAVVNLALFWRILKSDGWFGGRPDQSLKELDGSELQKTTS